jgi:acyl-CoA thioester hydrolase
MSLFSAVEMAPRDPILGLNEQFAADPNPNKVNLGVGVYTGDDGKVPLLECVRRAERLMVEVPPYAAVRSLTLTSVESQASLAQADALGMQNIALGAIMPQECDVFGRMRPEQFIGRVSDGIGRLVQPLRKIVSDNAGIPLGPIGGAVLEYRLIYLDWPMAGDRVSVRSGLQGADSRTMRVLHWILDPETGKAWGTSEAVVITFDLDARKVVPISETAQSLLREQATPGLTL